VENGQRSPEMPVPPQTRFVTARRRSGRRAASSTGHGSARNTREAAGAAVQRLFAFWSRQQLFHSVATTHACHAKNRTVRPPRPQMFREG